MQGDTTCFETKEPEILIKLKRTLVSKSAEGALLFARRFDSSESSLSKCSFSIFEFRKRVAECDLYISPQEAQQLLGVFGEQFN